MEETAVLAGGCFWCIDTLYRDIRGVQDVISGYSGGHQDRPTYEDVGSGRSGHAEVVKVEFDPDIVSFEQLLRVFFVIHDPTTLNRQGNDIGTQYRSAIFYIDETQKDTAEKVMREISDEGIWNNKIVTEIIRFKDFYPAEEYHQDYYNRNQSAAYCKFVIEPKVAKFRKKFIDILR